MCGEDEGGRGKEGEEEEEEEEEEEGRKQRVCANVRDSLYLPGFATDFSSSKNTHSILHKVKDAPTPNGVRISQIGAGRAGFAFLIRKNQQIELSKRLATRIPRCLRKMQS
ncbi:hypothetical protein P175DRAFT_0528620 [Aspergillus ochraceoroseus IBT 24754]|uniref:Uncharacterized protein n=1 Tax=Aspergillus ochraceoroseus IBT 24754 TaxID=1392256 RepID=A0A2T5M979_9EURO|nr:uncharacterized protein P175DRAFT_0528620 [Aspergillus ochraceoroseus IBT 24754]PTU25091.1 hypothetical protein P175DRAFT_0528620 [Aspergillus ochraceoroseus IBT 24754]